MVKNLNDRTELERFLRDANADELNADREYLQTLITTGLSGTSESTVRVLAARISYELRFRLPRVG